MSRSGRGLDRDLALVALLTLAGAVVTALPLPDSLRAVVFIPLVLGASGYAIAAALFLPGSITGEERAVLAVALSVAAWALVGVVLQLVIDLDRWVWLAEVVVVTLAALAVAQGRRRTVPDTRPARRLHRPGAGPLAAVVLAAAIAVVALAVASGSQQRELDRAHFSSIWIAPHPANAPRPAPRISIGVRNQEGQPVEYGVVVATKGRTIDEWELRLDDQETWVGSVPAGEAEAAVVASLLRNGAPYRRVKLEYGALK